MSPRPLLAALLALPLTACGDRVFTHPETWDKVIAFPSGYDPIDLNDLIRRHPELDGLVMLAPTYKEMVERERAQAVKEGRPAVPEYRVTAGTAFSLVVTDAPELSTTFTVGPDGYVDVQLIGVVQVLNRTYREIKEEITSRLRRYYLNPQVAINPAAIPAPGLAGGRLRSGKIMVFSSGVSQLDYLGDETLMSVLSTAGFSGSSDWRQIRVMQRPNAARGRPRGRFIIADVVAFAYGDFNQDFPIEPEDVVFIPTKWSWWQQFDAGWGHMLKFLGNPLTINGLKNTYQTTF